MSSIPEEIKKALLEVLAQIPQRVLWKYENELEDIPKNVMVRKWLPQRDILFRCGGVSGVYETLDAEVPVLGLPVSGDQPRNLENLVNAGMAISMDLLSITNYSFLRNVLELLNDKKYKENIETTSKIFKDRPILLEESVVYWTEYVLRHKGAPHLKSHALNLRWYEYFSLGVL
ncbi:UDP-glucosyltransferase 2-like [Metopolophium dirhodum]|uniref:UDP-glucosyltransferase 2-like n=1 Tax=Metopolophium dirhodum TaxID=44670 RepID=UPI00298FCCC7|nr:UDP-glucosyltransferase 2-like [Metopolophium dirhodum]